MSIMQMLLATSSGSSLDMSTLYATKIYTGNGSSQSINNGLDLTTDNAMVWIKRRTEQDVQTDPTISDTVNGVNKYLNTNRINGLETDTNRVTAFNNNGFSVGSSEEVNRSFKSLASWTFKTAASFFDIVNYTGNGVAGRTISHNLGVEPGCIFFKNKDTTNNFDWSVYHVGMGVTQTARLNEEGAAISGEFNNTAPTSSVFSVSGGGRVNRNGEDHVAYLFAKDTANAIKCDSYTGNGTGQSINLGFEPAWLLIKETSNTGPWQIYDDVRTFSSSAGEGLDAGDRHSHLEANSNEAEHSNSSHVMFTSTGFDIGNGSAVNTNTENYIYVAIAAP